MAGAVFPDLSGKEMNAWRSHRPTCQEASGSMSATSNANVHPQLADLHFVLDPLLLVFETEELSSLITPLGRVDTF